MSHILNVRELPGRKIVHGAPHCPWNGSYCSVPPFTMARPSARTTIPLQNISQFTGCVVTVTVAGSKMAACKFVFVGRLPEPETISTLPLCKSAACTGLMGMRFGSVCHWPCTLACPVAEGTLPNERKPTMPMTSRDFAQGNGCGHEKKLLADILMEILPRLTSRFRAAKLSKPRNGDRLPQISA